MLHITTNDGLHEYVSGRIFACYMRTGMLAADLGAGPDAMAAPPRSLGCDVVAVDRDAIGSEAGVPHQCLDFNEPDFASQLGLGGFGLVKAIEVFEHVENPIGFSRNVGRLLARGSVAVLTTPNVDSLPARLKSFLAGKFRMMDEHSEPSHITPIFFDLLERQYLPQAGVRLREHLVFPPNGFQLTRKPLVWRLRLASLAFSGQSLLGDNHILVLEARS